MRKTKGVIAVIPKVIHYCWFGGNQKSKLVEDCIASWRKHCPEWKIIEWNETNFDVHSNVFMSEAYNAKKWAFVSDVARLQVVLQHGGVYLDTDVELLASLDDLCENGAFFAFETERQVNTGTGFGAEKGHRAVKAMLRTYEDRHFLIRGKPDQRPCPSFNTEELVRDYPTIRRDGTTQTVEDVLLLSCGEYAKRAIHHGAASWGDNPKTEIQPLKQYNDTPIKRAMKNPKCFAFVERYLGKRMLKVYSFIAYDLVEYGPLHFIKRFFRKLVHK